MSLLQVNQEYQKRIIEELLEVFNFFQELNEIYNKLIIHRAVKPEQALIQIESFFFHMLKVFTTDDKDVLESNLIRGRSHIERLALDAVKLYWEDIFNSLKLLHQNRLLEDNGFYKKYISFLNFSKEARLFETTCLGKTIPDKKEVINKYNSTFGVPKVEKFEIRISKSETNSNFLMFK
jgi:serine/threonine protein kinase